MKKYTPIKNMFIGFLIAGLITGWDVAHTPKQVATTSVVNSNVVLAKEAPTTLLVQFKVSHYWPELGGTNCGNFVNGKCISRMANGKRWQDHVGIAVACPKELALGTKIRVGDRDWVCMDRGGAIKMVSDRRIYWVDQLTPEALYPYGALVDGEIYLK